MKQRQFDGPYTNDSSEDVEITLSAGEKVRVQGAVHGYNASGGEFGDFVVLIPGDRIFGA